ncbi:MAG: tRNA (adenosine(37)-N6)-threonylcarbamoyltransferase complex transferase subunit TsaD, partial [Vicinamibacteria bacterium]
MKVLGIETSCDDTAFAVLDGRSKVLSNFVSSQTALHRPYGGVVPELASRHHLENIEPLFQETLSEAGVSLSDIDAVAVTAGPGLIGSLLVGVSFAKALAWSTRKPLVAVNHLEGHVRAAFIESPDLPFPAVALVVSGGHTSLYLCPEEGTYRLLARTRDDAAGEAFDKAARLLGLGYPGGPIIDRLAKEGDATAVPLPRARMSDGSLDFSFSGLKTALLRYARAASLAVERGAPSSSTYDPHGPEKGPVEEVEKSASRTVRDIAASFQRAVVDVLVDRTMTAAEREGVEAVIVSGGVACNSLLRARFAEEAGKAGMDSYAVSPALAS